MSRQISVIPEVTTFDFDTVTDAMYRMLGVLGSYADRDGWCYPALKTLAARMQRTEGAVSKMIAKLSAAGYVKLEYRTRNGRRRCHYQIIFDRPLEASGSIPDDAFEDAGEAPAEGARVSPTETVDENEATPRVDVGESHDFPSGKGAEGRELTPGQVSTFPQKESVLLISSPITKSTTPPLAANDAASSAVVLETWNAMALSSGLPRARDTEKRRKVIATRLREAGWLEDFRAACAAIAASGFHRGANERRWVATIDFALQPGKATTLAEQAAAKPVATVPSAGALEELDVGGGQRMSVSVFWRVCTDAGLAAPMQTADMIREGVERLHRRGTVQDPHAFTALVLHVNPAQLAEIKFGKDRDEQLRTRLASWRPMAGAGR